MLPLLRRGNKKILDTTTKFKTKLDTDIVEEPGWRGKTGESLEKDREIPSAHRAGGRDYRLLAMYIGSRITC